MLVNERYVHGGRHSDKEFIDMSFNINPCGTPETVMNAMQEALHEVCGYPDATCGGLVDKLGKEYGLPYDCIICGNGADEIIYNYASILGAGASALIYAPAFAEYERALSAYGVKINYHILNEKRGFKMQMSDIDDDEIAQADAVFICMPSNPAGQLIERNVLEKLADTCKRLKTKCFLDMCFYELTMDYNICYVTYLVNQYSNLCVLSAFTKTYAIPGVRLGYMLSRDTKLIHDISRRQQCWNVSVIAQRAGIACLDCTDYVETSRAFIKKEREYIYNNLLELVDKVYKSDANYVLFYDEYINCQMINEYGIQIRNCFSYAGLKMGYYRVCVGKHDDNVKLIKALKDIKEKRSRHGEEKSETNYDSGNHV